MAVATQVAPSPSEQVGSAVNDFVINVATANGTGSQTSNIVILRTLFKMGIPITGKNLFPSNIQGLPTWYIIRLSKEGYHARREGTDIMVCMNGATVADDMASVAQNGVVIYDDALPIAARREDVTYYPIPVKELIKSRDVPTQLKDYIANMAYVGVLAWVLGMDMAEIYAALDWNFDHKQKAVDLNMGMIQAAYDWAGETLTKKDGFSVTRMTGFNEGKFLVDGNTAGALGSIYGGVNLLAWYPITPSSSLAETIISHLPKLRKDADTGGTTCAVVQAEDELAAIGMVIGGGWAGARAMTATSGPGISLMAEFTGLAYFAEIPATIWNVQRMGPSTGLPTRTSQGDILSTYYLSHGDTRHPILFPKDPQECFEFGWKALDLADAAQTPVFVLSDLDLGMNLWTTDNFDYPDTPINQGKVLNADQIKEAAGTWGRYLDKDGDGITYRTLPGNESNMSAYFTRGTGHDEYARYSERSDVWERNMHRLTRKFDTIRDMVPAPVVDEMDGATVGIISLGTNDPAVEEARDRLAAKGVKTNYLRLRALPINQTVRNFILNNDKLFVVESNHDGQANIILRTEMPEAATKLISLALCDGMPISPRWIVENITARL